MFNSFSDPQSYNNISSLELFEQSIYEYNEDRALSILLSQNSVNIDPNSPYFTLPVPHFFLNTQNEQPYKLSPLQLACKYSMLKLFVTLLQKGGNPHMQTIYGESCGHLVCSDSNNPNIRFQILEIILQTPPFNSNNISVHTLNVFDNFSNSCLHYASFNNLKVCCLLLISYGQSCDMFNLKGETPSDLAHLKGYYELSSILELGLTFQINSQLENYLNMVKQQELEFQHQKKGTEKITQHENQYQKSAASDEIIAISVNESSKFNTETKSLKFDELMHHMDNLIEETSIKLNESTERVELLLNYFNYDDKNLSNNIKKNYSKVLKKLNLKNKTKRNINDIKIKYNFEGLNFGISISSVYNEIYDSSHNQRFKIFRNGTEYSYVIKKNEQSVPNTNQTDQNQIQETNTLNGENEKDFQNFLVFPIKVDSEGNEYVSKTSVSDDVQEDEDSNKNINLHSHTSPTFFTLEEDKRNTVLCTSCNKKLLQPTEIHHYFNNEVVFPSDRVILCGSTELSKSNQSKSSHFYCTYCWSQSFCNQLEQGTNKGFITCPKDDCGEIINYKWANILIPNEKKHILLNKFFALRQENLFNKLNIHWCPIPNCGLLVKTIKEENEDVTLCVDIKKKKKISSSATCLNGHSFCLKCKKESHAPVDCGDVSNWLMILINEQPHHLVSSFLHNSCSQLFKSCPSCNKKITKIKNFSQQLIQELETAYPFNNVSQISNLNDIISFIDNLGEVQPISYISEGSYEIDGCNIVTCKSCCNSFCWVCLNHWSTHSFSNNYHENIKKFNIDLIKSHSCNQIYQTVSYENFVNSNSDSEYDADVFNFQYYLLNTFLHRSSRYLIHAQSYEAELKTRNETMARLQYNLDEVKAGSLEWVLGENVAKSLFLENSNTNNEQVEEKDGLFSGLFLKKQENHLEFLNLSYEELLASRLLLKWSYVFSFFELDDIYKVRIDFEKHPDLIEKYNYLKEKFINYQGILEINVELVSNLIGKNRIKGSKNQIDFTIFEIKKYRIFFEEIIFSLVNLFEPCERIFNYKQFSQEIDISKFDINKADTYNIEISQLCPRPQIVKESTINHEIIITALTSTSIESCEAEIFIHDPLPSPRTPISKPGSSISIVTPPATHSAPDPYINNNDSNQILYSNNPLLGKSSKINGSKFSDKELNIDSDMFTSNNMSSSIYTSISDPSYISSPSNSSSINKIYNFHQNIQPNIHTNNQFNTNSSFYNVNYIHSNQTTSDNPNFIVSKSSYNIQEDIDNNHQRVTEVINITEQRLIGGKKDPDQEALEHAILISKQEEEFGINMYDALVPEDELFISDLMSQGFTREESILICFENKFGKVNDSKITPAMPTLHKLDYQNTSEETFIEKLSPENEIKVEILMQKGYTREQAVKIINENLLDSSKIEQVSSNLQQNLNISKSSVIPRIADDNPTPNYSSPITNSVITPYNFNYDPSHFQQNRSFVQSICPVNSIDNSLYEMIPNDQNNNYFLTPTSQSISSESYDENEVKLLLNNGYTIQQAISFSNQRIQKSKLNQFHQNRTIDNISNFSNSLINHESSIKNILNSYPITSNSSYFQNTNNNFRTNNNFNTIYGTNNLNNPSFNVPIHSQGSNFDDLPPTPDITRIHRVPSFNGDPYVQYHMNQQNENHLLNSNASTSDVTQNYNSSPVPHFDKNSTSKSISTVMQSPLPNQQAPNNQYMNLNNNFNNNYSQNFYPYGNGNQTHSTQGTYEHNVQSRPNNNFNYTELGIQQLMNYGLDQNYAHHLLSMCNNDVDRAIMMLQNQSQYNQY